MEPDQNGARTSRGAIGRFGAPLLTFSRRALQRKSYCSTASTPNSLRLADSAADAAAGLPKGRPGANWDRRKSRDGTRSRTVATFPQQLDEILRGRPNNTDVARPVLFGAARRRRAGPIRQGQLRLEILRAGRIGTVPLEVNDPTRDRRARRAAGRDASDRRASAPAKFGRWGAALGSRSRYAPDAGSHGRRCSAGPRRAPQ